MPLLRSLSLPAMPRPPSPERLLAAVTERLAPGRPGAGRSRPKAWQGATRTYVQIPGLGHPAAKPLRDALERELPQLTGVRSAVVNGVMSSVVLELAQDADVAEVLHEVSTVIAACPDGGNAKEAPLTNPGSDGAVARAATALVADVAGLSVSTASWFLRRTPLPLELAASITFIDTQPRLRRSLGEMLGEQRAEVLIALSNAVAQALAQGSTGLAVDIAARSLQLAEARARRGAWERADRELPGGTDALRCEAIAAERPQALRPGPVERYSEHLAVTAAASFGLTLAVSRSLARAGSVAVSTLPKAAPMGRDAFAATLGRALASRGVVVVDQQALRRLDRVDAVVLDAGALVSERLAIGDVVPVGGGGGDQAALAVYRLADPAAPLSRRSDGEFTLAPLEELDLVGTRGVRAAAALSRGGAVAVLGLARARRLQAVIAVVREPAGAADALAAATRRAGLDLVVAGAAPGPAARSADRVVPGGSRLVASVRALQGDGQGVLLVSRNRRALVAADVGLGIPAADGTPAWGADILLRDDLSAAALLIEAAGAEAAVSRRGVNLARAGTALGAAMALSGRAARLSGRSLLAVNSAAAASMASGVWTASELLRRPVSPPVSRTPWHAMPAEAVLRAVDSTAAGLTGPEARRRRRGDADEKDATPSLLRAFATELANPLTPILVGGAALSASIGAVTDAAIVVGVGGVSALIGGVQRVATDRAVAELLRRSAIYGRVLRGGQDQVLPAGELVVGDVVRLVSGDVVPADCRIIEAHEVEVDESSLTGESLPVRKQVNAVLAGDIADRHSMLYEGTTVAAGRCLAVVVATGSSTEVGRSMAATRPASRVSGVEARLAAITRTTLPIALGSAGAVMLAGILRGRPARDSLGAGVGLAVASVPEGLPFLVSAAQLAAARRLSGRGVLVRDPRTIETLGRVDVLCFDKTGTLTEGRIALRGVSTGGRLQPPAALDDGARAALVAAVRATPRARGSRAPEHLTDRAVLEGAARASVRREEGHRALRRLGTLPFEPSRGFHAVLDDADGNRLLSVKGAPELVLPRCTGWAGREPGTDWRAAAEAEVERLTGRGYRVLAVAERSGVGPTRLSEPVVAGLTLRGFIAFADPVRGQAGASVRDLRAAGVQVVMITGDHPRTAAAIGDELGVTNGGRVVTGAQLDALDDAALDELLPRVSVVARSTPAHKVRVVQAFQRLGRTVAMTGDGANDAPAIRLADVGIALGRRGTPAARAAADLVVTDDRLETILAALIEGRAMWGSVRRALGILVGGNLGEIAFTLFGASLTGRSPLSARQLLLVNMLTDLAPAVALAVRPPEESAVATLLAEGPEASLGGVLVDEIAVRALATAAGASGAWIAGRLTGRPARARTVGLAALVGTQLGQTLVAGGASPSVVFASLGSAAALFGVVQTPGVSQFFGCTPLGPVGWATAAGWAAAGTAGSLALPPLWRAVRPRGGRIVVRLQDSQRRPLQAIPATVAQLVKPAVRAADPLPSSFGPAVG